MTDIPWWAHIGVGIVVSGFSKFVELRSQQNMTLFFYVGILFVIFGLGKYAFKIFITNKSLNHNLIKSQHHSRNYQHNQLNKMHNPNNLHHQNKIPNNSIQNQYNHNNRSTQHHYKNNSNTSIHEMNSIISCPRCGTKHYSFANFCMSCGNRLK